MLYEQGVRKRLWECVSVVLVIAGALGTLTALGAAWTLVGVPLDSLAGMFGVGLLTCVGIGTAGYILWHPYAWLRWGSTVASTVTRTKARIISDRAEVERVAGTLSTPAPGEAGSLSDAPTGQLSEP